MQDCFRQHPEMYGSELEDDEDEVEEELLARDNGSPNQFEEPSSATGLAPVAQKTTEPSEPKAAEPKAAPKVASTVADKKSKATTDSTIQASSGEQDDRDKDDELIPKAAHDATRR